MSNQIFLVADSEPSGRLSHFYVSADHEYVLAGSKVNISAAAVDTNFIPMDRDYTLKASAGTMDGNVLTTPSRGGRDHHYRRERRQDGHCHGLCH